MRLFYLSIGLLAAGMSCQAQVVTLNFNSLPSAQGWTFHNGSAAPESSLFSVNGTSLHMNTIGIGETGADYTLSNVVNGNPFTLTVTARVTADEVFVSDCTSCVPSPDAGHIGLGFGVEVGGQEYYVGLGPGFVDAFVSPGIEVVLSSSIDTTQYHIYMLAGNPATGGFTLSVDGNQIGSGTAGPEPPTNDIFVGDGTSLANATGDYTRFTFRQCPKTAPLSGAEYCGPNEYQALLADPHGTRVTGEATFLITTPPNENSVQDASITYILQLTNHAKAVEGFVVLSAGTVIAHLPLGTPASIDNLSCGNGCNFNDLLQYLASGGAKMSLTIQVNGQSFTLSGPIVPAVNSFMISLGP